MPEITSSGFLTRTAIEYLTTDRCVKHYRCNTLQNPLAYYDGTQFSPVAITEVVDSYTDKAKGILLRGKNVVSVGIKKADDAYKFLGFRPDEKQDGSEQLEFSLETIELGGKAKNINLSQKAAKTSTVYDLGPLVVQSRRQGTRISLPVSNTNDGFKVGFRLHLTGLKIEYIEPLDEYWVFNEQGQFRFRLCKPLLLDPATGEPLQYEDEPGRYDGLVKHSLKDLGGGEYLYVKEPTEAWGKIELPKEVLVDADTVYSTSEDGFVYHYASTWSSVRGATTGSSTGSYAGSNISAYYVSSYYRITRSFFYFDTTGLSGEVTASTEYLYGNSYGQSSVYALGGTQADTLTTADFAAFGSALSSNVAWGVSVYKQIPFNASGLSFMNYYLGGMVKVCNREYNHDGLNSSPGSSTYYNGCQFSEASGTGSDPYLYITITAPYSASGSDSGTGADSSSTTRDYPLYETGSGTDLNATIDATALVSDTGGCTDSATPDAWIEGGMDAGAGADSYFLSLIFGATDAGVLSDEHSGPIGVMTLDQGAVGEALSLASSSLWMDAGTGDDAGYPRFDSATTDVGAGADTGAVAAAYTLTDAALVTETGDIMLTEFVTDGGAVADITSVDCVVRDLGEGYEAHDLSVGAVVLDSAGLTELGAIFFSQTALDQGAGVDTSIVAWGFFGADCGVGTDSRPLMRGSHVRVARLASPGSHSEVPGG